MILSKIAKFGVPFTIVYTVIILATNAILGTEYQLTIYPNIMTVEALVLGIVAGALTWLMLSDGYEAKYTFGEGIIGEIVTAIVIGFIVATTAGILGLIVNAMFAGAMTTGGTIVFGVYILIVVLLNGLPIIWLAEEK